MNKMRKPLFKPIKRISSHSSVTVLFGFFINLMVKHFVLFSDDCPLGIWKYEARKSSRSKKRAGRYRGYSITIMNIHEKMSNKYHVKEKINYEVLTCVNLHLKYLFRLF